MRLDQILQYKLFVNIRFGSLNTGYFVDGELFS